MFMQITEAVKEAITLIIWGLNSPAVARVRIVGWQGGGAIEPAEIQGHSPGHFAGRSGRSWAIWEAIQKAACSEG